MGRPDHIDGIKGRIIGMAHKTDRGQMHDGIKLLTFDTRQHGLKIRQISLKGHHCMPCRFSLLDEVPTGKT
jgi:hypothetical protein